MKSHVGILMKLGKREIGDLMFANVSRSLRRLLLLRLNLGEN